MLCLSFHRLHPDRAGYGAGVSYGWFDMRSEMLLDVLIVIIVVALRLLSVGFNVTLPGAVERHRVYLPSESRYLKRPVIHPYADTGDTPNTKDEEDKPQDGSRPPQANCLQRGTSGLCRMTTAFKVGNLKGTET